MHFHLYRISTFLVPTSPPTPHPTPFTEYDTDLTYEFPSTIPVIVSTVHITPQKSFLVKCRREGDATDVGLKDLAFEVFLDGVWIGGCNLRAGDPTPHPRSRTIINERHVSGLQISRTAVRPFTFTSSETPSLVEVLVRTGGMLPLKKPARAEKGLQDVSSRDGFSRPVLLAPLLQRPDLQRFEPDSALVSVSRSVESPAKDWVEGINALGKGTVGLSEEKTQIREVKRIDWKDLKSIALFRFRCVVAPSIQNGSCGAAAAGWVMGKQLVPMDARSVVSTMKRPEHFEIIEEEEDDGMTEIEGD